jgi:hypothetical protein
VGFASSRLTAPLRTSKPPGLEWRPSFLPLSPRPPMSLANQAPGRPQAAPPPRQDVVDRNCPCLRSCVRVPCVCHFARGRSSMPSMGQPRRGRGDERRTATTRGVPVPGEAQSLAWLVGSENHPLPVAFPSLPLFHLHRVLHTLVHWC